MSSSKEWTFLAALILGCGSPPTDNDEMVFTSLSLDPASATICTVEPGNTVALTATARDQSGQSMIDVGNPTFTTSNPGAATVDANGLATALAAGSAQITASLTANGTTRTAAAIITVASALTGDAPGSVATNHPLPHVAVITAAQLSSPGTLTLDIQGEALHSHTLSLTGTQVAQIAAGCLVSRVSSVATHSDGSSPHSHTVTFN